MGLRTLDFAKRKNGLKVPNLQPLSNPIKVQYKYLYIVPHCAVVSAGYHIRPSAEPTKSFMWLQAPAFGEATLASRRLPTTSRLCTSMVTIASLTTTVTEAQRRGFSTVKVAF